MVLQAWPLGRLLVAGAAAILLLSTGATSGIFAESEAVAGHTAFVAAVVSAAGPHAADPAPVIYGLATLQEAYLFGLIVRPRALDDSANRMVFVWAAPLPDPRADPTLEPTGEWARVSDRGGSHWVVHEFRYAGGADGLAVAPEGLFAYGVEVGAVRTLDDGTRYNHVLTHRPERLAAPFLDAAGPNEQISVPLSRGVGEPPASLALPPAGVSWASLARIG